MTKYSGKVMEASNEPFPGAHLISIFNEDYYIPFITMFPGKHVRGSMKFMVKLGLATASLVIPIETLRIHLERADQRKRTKVYFDYSINRTVVLHAGPDAQSGLSFDVTDRVCGINVMVMDQMFTVAVHKADFLKALKTMEETYNA